MQDFMSRPIVPRVRVLRGITWGLAIFGFMGSWALSLANVPVGVGVVAAVLFALAGAFSEDGSWEACTCACCADEPMRCQHCGSEMAVGLFCPDEHCRPERFVDEREDEDSPYGLTA